ncbi:palmitoyltransferase ZDHHC12-A [Trichomycterus rosablanca]|uniref:palmitoyltransferase ZDHHC12-A n=1 Tax=Trichomycterus rosablanca TaxID=2290929 RepID=UPI002F34F875
MFKSGCLVRTTHVVVTWLTTVVLFLHNTDLRKREEREELLQPVLFGAIVLMSVILYFTVSLMDPGYVLFDSDTQIAPVDSNAEELEQMITQCDSLPRQRRCGYCFVLQPMRAKHCKKCKKCVRRFDHHCPWLDNCVGEKNHKWFLLYLFVQLLALSWGLQAAWSGFTVTSTWRQWFVQNGLLFGALLVTGIFSFVVLLLLSSHLYLVAINTTTWEFMSFYRISYLKSFDSEKSPFDRGVICNLWKFFCMGGTVAWEKVYSRGTSCAV